MNALKIRAALFGTALLMAGAAAAQNPIQGEGAVPTIEVSYADLDLGSEGGVAALQRRVRAAASRLCLGYAGGDLEERMGRRACFNTALASAHGPVEQAIAEFGRTQLAGRATITIAAR